MTVRSTKKPSTQATIRDRQRVTKLVEQHFSDQMFALRQPPDEERVQNLKAAIASEFGVTAMIRRHDKIEEKRKKLAQEIHKAINGHDSECSCFHDFDQELGRIARKRLDTSGDIARLREKRKEILAKIERAETRDQLSAALVLAGL